MVRYILLLFFSFSYISAQAQVKIGAQLSPTLSFNRFNDDEALEEFGNSGIGGRLIAGAIVDYMFQENYYLSSGIFFVPKRVGIERVADGREEAYRLHYVQLPATAKLFTNEIALDVRLYFQAGFAIDIKILEDNLSDDPQFVSEFRNLDASLLLGTGAEYQLGYNTILFGGFSYRRGLGNVVRSTDANVGDLVIKNDLFSLDMGIKF
ncbi:MAG: outer membrane beta-barrel protein [Tunicatimonas sp.]|uniref:outer membrane beta-barrel protein n=1 Tax=Tunicatimonas sp. TaxID=1940096 RepID=UPI003C7301DE